MLPPQIPIPWPPLLDNVIDIRLVPDGAKEGVDKELENLVQMSNVARTLSEGSQKVMLEAIQKAIQQLNAPQDALKA
jgi:DNA-binding TFAR19-related protein (PDSD5 family)